VLPFESKTAQLEAHEELPVVWDMFCGTGSIGISLSSIARAVVGLEVKKMSDIMFAACAVSYISYTPSSS
jgi:tRNA/tmRNA/rRNA uracil-C5-methylase (TrmA/RlmC/RlmD family)